jgi:tetratricopeptide (TPR) repeat protein
MKPSHALLYLTLLSAAGMSAREAYALSQQELQATMNPQEVRIDQLRNAEIQQLRLVLTRSASREQQPDLLLRLSELYTEKYKLYFLKESESWSKKMDAYLALPLEQQKYRHKPTLDSTSSKQWLTLAVQTLEKIPLQKERYSRIDEVYYFLGFNQWELGRKTEGARSFTEIVEHYPKSRFFSEAERYLADYSFANREFDRARRYYESAARSGETPARPRILYGLAWSYFKLQNYKKAIDTMKEAISIGRNNEEAAKAGLALQRDAADSLALFYSEGGNVEEAAAYFSDLFGEGEAVVVLRKLAENYQRQGQYAKALAINKQLLSMGGAAGKQAEDQRFEIMVNSLNVAAQKGDRDKQEALLKAMTAEFVTNAKETNPERVETLQTAVRKAAALAHKEGNKSRNPKAAYGRAEDLYRLYLSAYAAHIKPEDAAEIHYYLADVLSQEGKPKEAAAEQRYIMEQGQSDPAFKKYSKDAAAGIVYTLDSLLKNKGADKHMARADADQVIGAIDSYVHSYPHDKDVPKYLARAAGILVTTDRMDDARPRLKELVEKYPASKEAWDAAATLLKEAEDHKDYAKSEELSREFLENRPLMAQDAKGTFRKTLQTVIDRSQFKATQVAEKDNPGLAAQRYEKLAAEAKDPAVRAASLTNAAVTYGRAGDHANELRVYEHILEVQPGNEQAERNLLAVANEQFLSGRYAEAAESFEHFYQIYLPKMGSLKPGSQKYALESLRSAALLRRALQQNDKANEDFRSLVDAANKGNGAARDAAGDFLFDAAKRLRDEGNTPEAIRSFQKYSSSFPDGAHAVGANMEVAVLYQQLKEEEKAQNYFRTTISKVKGKGGKASPEELGYGARARLELLGPLEEAFERSPLRLPEAQLKADINAKLQALDRLNKGYVEVMDFGDGNWGVEAFRRMALAYRTFAQALERAPVPQNYSDEDKAKFKAQLKGVAAPVYLKVGETLDTALQKGEQLQVVGPSMARTYVLAAVNSARPDRLPLVQDADWSHASDWLAGEQPGSEGAVDSFRASLKKEPDNAAAWTAVGNYHMLKGEKDLAEIFYLQALGKNSKYVPALNNLAYLKGIAGDVQKAFAGFKAALSLDEFAIAPKKNMARLFMASGLWRHASLNYRQLEVRAPNDHEIKRGVALAALATGHVAQAGQATSGQSGTNARFAEAVLALGKGDRATAANLFNSLAGESEYARLISDFWNTKENN